MTRKPTSAIRWTAPPGKKSPRYSGPFELEHSATVRARAYKDGQTRSIVVQETMIIDD